jgi:chemotaxis protein MotB
MHQFLALAAVSFALTGCVTSTDKFEAQRLENENLRNQLGDAQSQAKTAMAERDILKQQIATLSTGLDGQGGLLQNKDQQLLALTGQLAEINAKYQALLANPPMAGGALPPVLSNALDGFAKENPELVDFDAGRGIVKFKTDFTFAKGSDALTEKAKQAITRFASILNSDAAKTYELMVAGHTDSTPVVNPQTKAKHPDNWYLSSHRAIAVGDELLKHQVSGQRVAVVGYADQRPIASNGTSDGQAQNRRVEVLILPSTVRNSIAKTGPAPKTGTGAAKKPGNNLNKDSSIARPDGGPIYNK